ncbi:AAEL007567-PA [Aedes aegypti]|uniref:AAEL007567-PA n=1 Tax=Aedes aegypti TaxID=7159 RepID=Q171Q9_AEDAE|nr:AAEL007567-PA [Aedes aegypti]
MKWCVQRAFIGAIRSYFTYFSATALYRSCISGCSARIPEAPPIGKCLAASSASSFVLIVSAVASSFFMYCSTLPPARWAWQRRLSKEISRFTSSEIIPPMRSKVSKLPEAANLLRKYLKIRGIGCRFCSSIASTNLEASFNRSRLTKASITMDCSVRFSLSLSVSFSLAASSRSASPDLEATLNSFRFGETGFLVSTAFESVCLGFGWAFNAFLAGDEGTLGATNGTSYPLAFKKLESSIRNPSDGV